MSLFRSSLRSYNLKKFLDKAVSGTKNTRVIANKTFSNYGELRQSAAAEEAIKPPQSETISQDEKTYSPKITTIVDQISSLNLLEVADLNELLKAKLKIR